MTGNQDDAPASTLRDKLQVAQAILLATFAVIPAFLTGSMAVGIRAELGLGPAALGFAVAWFFVTTSLSTSTLGKRVDGLATRASLTLGASLSAVALFAIAAAPRYLLLVLALTLGGIANAISQPAVNAALSRRIPADRLGLAFGIKQSAIPAATLLGGLAVPTLGVTIGWRGTFVVVAVLAVIGAGVTWFTGDGAERPVRRRRLPLRESQAELSSLLILTFGGLLAAAAATALGAFMVDAAVEGGIAEARAGLLAAAASAVGLLSRVVLGWYADRHPLVSRYGMITTLVLLGVPGFLLLATGVPVLYLLGAILAYAAGWGWTGLFHYTVVSQNPTTPATSTGVIQTGLSFGAGMGPLVMGVVAQTFSYPAGWYTAAGLGLAGAGFFALGRWHLRRRLSAAATRAISPSPLPLLQWEESRARPQPDGVRVSVGSADDVGFTLVRVPAGVRWRTRAATTTGMIAVLEGVELAFTLGTTVHRADAGDAITLPPHLLWSVHNEGPDEATLALLVPRES